MTKGKKIPNPTMEMSITVLSNHYWHDYFTVIDVAKTAKEKAYWSKRFDTIHQANRAFYEKLFQVKKG